MQKQSESAHATAAARRVAWLLDESIPLPGGRKIGLDGVIGLIPGLGDGVGLLSSTYILLTAFRLGASLPSLIRMLGNVLLESVVGTIPLAGDLFDFYWKANVRNIRLLDDELANPRQARRKSFGAVLLFCAALLAIVVMAGWLIISILGWIVAAAGAALAA